MMENMLCSESSIKIFLGCGRYVFNNKWDDGLQTQKMNIVSHYDAYTPLPLPVLHIHSHK